MPDITKKALLLWCMFLPVFNVVAIENSEIDAEIIRIRKELANISGERRETKENSQKDFSEHSSYLSSIQLRFTSVRAEIDSLKLQQVKNRSGCDSLEGLIRSEKSRQQQLDLMQSSFRKQLVVLCSNIETEANKIPPLSSKQFVTTLAFVKSELIASNIDNIEGLQRIFQILKDLEDETLSIQISSGSSPLPEIRGTVYRLRIGTFFEAAVDSKGMQYALWTGIDSTGAEQWTAFNDADGATKILKAVNIREGKTLPSFAELPFPPQKVLKR